MRRWLNTGRKLMTVPHSANLACLAHRSITPSSWATSSPCWQLAHGLGEAKPQPRTSFLGQRFSWWLISFSLVATHQIGSYSFVKYSNCYSYGIASSQTYLNNWFWIPLLLFGWLPILYFFKRGLNTEYFERRFGSVERQVATAILLVYLIGYVESTFSPWVKPSTYCLVSDFHLCSSGRSSLSHLCHIWRSNLCHHDRPLSRGYASRHWPPAARTRHQLPRWVEEKYLGQKPSDGFSRV